MSPIKKLLSYLAERISFLIENFPDTFIRHRATDIFPLDGGSKHVTVKLAYNLSATIVMAKNDKGIHHRIGLNYIGSQWIFIDEGDKFIITADADSVVLKGEGSVKYRKVVQTMVHETAWYEHIRHEHLTKIVNAKLVKVQVYGRNGHVDGRFTRKAQQALQKLLGEIEAESVQVIQLCQNQSKNA